MGRGEGGKKAHLDLSALSDTGDVSVRRMQECTKHYYFDNLQRASCICNLLYCMYLDIPGGVILGCPLPKSN